MQILAKVYTSLSLAHNGYIAGSGDGIVTVAGKPGSRKIWLLNAQTMTVEQVITSLSNGHYMFLGLDPAKRYMVMVRDLPPNNVDQRYEPFVWDYLIAADDLTIDEQMSLQASWQT
ncbi:hypothetical protein [Psychrobacter alimentarius]|uniref:hypothetical protein n=1 Tax=Psychrobacter alimentarius TaxID=261164 RepID=UPI003FD3AA98